MPTAFTGVCHLFLSVPRESRFTSPLQRIESEVNIYAGLQSLHESHVLRGVLIFIPRKISPCGLKECWTFYTQNFLGPGCLCKNLLSGAWEASTVPSRWDQCPKFLEALVCSVPIPRQLLPAVHTSSGPVFLGSTLPTAKRTLGGMGFLGLSLGQDFTEHSGLF